MRGKVRLVGFADVLLTNAAKDAEKLLLVGIAVIRKLGSNCRDGNVVCVG